MVDDGTDALRPALGHGGVDGIEAFRPGRKDDRTRDDRAGAAEAIGDADVGAGLVRRSRDGSPKRGGGGRAEAGRIARRIGDEVSANDGQQQAGGDPQGYGKAATRYPTTLHRRTR